MAIWDSDAEDERVDRALVNRGFVTKFRRRSVLQEAITELERLGYRVVLLDAGTWHDEADFHRDIAEALSFPSYYGRNLDALNDCLVTDAAEGEHGWDPANDTGLVLVFDNVDGLWAWVPDLGFNIIDICERAGRRGALFGNRLLTLMRSDDPWFDPGKIGADSADWNPEEWMTSRRLGPEDPQG